MQLMTPLSILSIHPTYILSQRTLVTYLNPTPHLIPPLPSFSPLPSPLLLPLAAGGTGVATNTNVLPGGLTAEDLADLPELIGDDGQVIVDTAIMNMVTEINAAAGLINDHTSSSSSSSSSEANTNDVLSATTTTTTGPTPVPVFVPSTLRRSQRIPQHVQVPSTHSYPYPTPHIHNPSTPTLSIHPPLPYPMFSLIYPALPSNFLPSTTLNFLPSASPLISSHSHPCF